MAFTPKQKAALADICSVPGKSGKFWSSKHPPQVLTSLERKGFVEGRAASALAMTSTRQAWYPTKRGERVNASAAALEQADEG